jgi:16S rRNA (cytidine1402-2'-O)-methyltransferase
VRKTLEDLVVSVKRPIIMARELTKMHEEFVKGTPEELLARFQEPQGEFTVIVPPADPSEFPAEAPSDDDVVALFGQITETGAFGSKRDVAREVGERLGMTAKQVYEVVERNK